MATYRTIVVGLGGLGSAALYRLAAELGAGVLGLEQFELGHHRGASQDHSRIIRLAQHEPQYAALAAPAYKAWEEVEAESCQQIVTRTGGLVIEDRAARQGRATGTRNIEGYTAMFDERRRPRLQVRHADRPAPRRPRPRPRALAPDRRLLDHAPGPDRPVVPAQLPRLSTPTPRGARQP